MKTNKTWPKRWNCCSFSWGSITNDQKDTCGMYQIYFYINLFNPLFIPLVINEKVLKSNWKTVELDIIDR